MRIPQLGGFRAQGKTADRAKELVDDAWAMVDAGCFSILCEVVTDEVTHYLAETLPVPVISLGAGSRADGVHIITSDLFHLYEEHTPRHSKIYFESSRSSSRCSPSTATRSAATSTPALSTPCS